MMSKLLKQSSGYTLIELLMAMTLFSTMLIVITLGFLFAVRLYRSGLAARETQSNARYGVNELVREARAANTAVVVQDTGNPVGSGNHFDSVCLNLNSHTSRYYVDTSVPAAKALVRRPHAPTETVSGACTAAEDIPGSSVEVLTSGTVNVVEMVIDRINGGPGEPEAVSFNMLLATSTAGSSLSGVNCTPGPGSEYCTVLNLSGTATLRGGEEIQ